jgi:integrase/recombinase XerD
MCEPARVKKTQARHQPLFRALKNGDGQPPRYLAIKARWASFYRGPLLAR